MICILNFLDGQNELMANYKRVVICRCLYYGEGEVGCTNCVFFIFCSEWYKEVAAAAFSGRKPSLGKAIVRFAWIELMFVGLFGFLNVSC